MDIDMAARAAYIFTYVTLSRHEMREIVEGCLPSYGFMLFLLFY